MGLYDRLIRGIALAGAFAFVAAGVLVLADVTLRASGFAPIRASSALSEYALLFGTMAGAPWLVRQKGHIAVTSLVDMAPPGLQRLAGLVGAVISIIVLAVLAWRSAVVGWDKAVGGAVDMRSIAIPEWISYAILAAGFALMATEFLRLILRGEAAPESHGGV